MTLTGRATHAVKSALAHTLYALGLLQLWQSVALRRKAVVLMYHRVLTADERRRSGSHPAIIVDRATFAKQMALLKRRFTVLSQDEFARCIESRTPFPDSACLITFDDGWADNYTNALPELEKQGLPAVVFLPVHFVGTRRMFWRESLTQVLMRMAGEVRRDPARREQVRALLAPAGLERLADIGDGDPRTAVLDAIDSRKDLALEHEALPATLARELGIDLAATSGADAFLDWPQAVAMSRRGVAFGGHGAEHRLLTHVTPAEADAEMAAASAVIAEKLGARAESFSYPNGNWTPAIAARVRAHGYRLAFTTEPGPVESTVDPFAIRRLNVHEDSTGSEALFLARLVGLL
ncbi:MAG TPA: polysaccharide deacetylase family protein [Vicinamibacterales bacterium]|nr:polysaccharide deacetylase family protein [Vicinamibacterales bacterium]